MRLQCWNRARYDIEIDLETGTGTRVKLDGARDEGVPPVGFAQFERPILGMRQVFAVFRQDDGIVFAAGKRKWRLDQPGLRLEHSRPSPFLSRFRVTEDGKVTFSILYSHVGRVLWAILDPTYDRIDEETDFFLAFMAEYGTSPEWLGNVLQRWSRAPGG